MKIAVFLHGTATMHPNGVGKTREERVRQSIKREASVFDYVNYIPVDNAVEKLNNWVNQGAEIIYFSSHGTKKDVEKDKISLTKHSFPEGPLVYRQNGESYAQMTENIMPDVLIEDDCESIGREVEMCYPNIKPELKSKIKHIVVKEFQGIDHLPNDLAELKKLH